MTGSGNMLAVPIGISGRQDLYLLQHGQQVADIGVLLVVQQHERVVEHGNLFVLAVDEVGRQISTAELHTFEEVELVLQITSC